MVSEVFGEIGFLGMLTSVAGLQGIILSAFILFRYRDDAPAMRWLALLILFMSLHLADMTLAKTQLIRFFAYVSDSTFSLLFLIGPLYYFYVRTLLKPQQQMRWLDLVHALPALFIFLNTLPWLLVDPQLKVEWQLKSQHATELNLPLITYLQLGFNILQNFVYLVLSLSLIKSVRLQVSAHSADGSISNDLGSLHTLTKAFAIWVGFYLLFFLLLAVWGEFAADIDHFWLFVNGVFVQIGGFVALTRPVTFGTVMRQLQGGREEESSETDTPKYSKSTLADDECLRLQNAFEQLMAKEKLHLDACLRMPDVAEKIGTSPHHFSQMLNQSVGTSFLAAVNKYRVEEVKRLMAEGERKGQTVLALAFEAGFNNKNSFNRAFRNETGETPTVYRRRIQAAG